MDGTDILKSCKNLHVRLDGDIDRMDLFEEVEMLGNITPENDRNYNALKYISSNNSTGSYLNVIIAYGYF